MTTTTRARLFLLLMAFTVVAAGCGGGGGSSTPPLSGSCSVDATLTRNGTEVMTTGTFNLVQSGASVTGDWIIDEGGPNEISGTFAGTVDADLNLTFTMTQTDPCPGIYSGSAMVNASDQVVGGFTGSDCSGPVMADFFLMSCTEDPPLP